MDKLRELVSEVITSSIYRHNAFRVTCISSDSPSEVLNRELKSLLIRTKIQGSQDEIDQVRTAIQQLQHPVTRIIHELFWIWHEPEPNSERFHTVSLHNRAVSSAAEAIDLGFTSNGNALTDASTTRLWHLWS